MKVFLEPVVRCFLDKILNKYFDYIEQIFITKQESPKCSRSYSLEFDDCKAVLKYI